VNVENLNSDIWKIGGKIQLQVNNKIEDKGIKLSEWSTIQFYRGITSGLNEAFHIDNDIRDDLINKDEKNKEIIKPLLRGKDIKRFKYKFKDWFIINSHNGLKEQGIQQIDVVKDYPLIYEYLLKFEKKLIERQDKGEHWTNLRNCAFLLEFEKPKIVWLEISNKANYTYDENGMFLTNSAYFMVGSDMKYLLAVLNSRLVDYYFFQITAKIAGGRKRYTKQYVKQVPIPQIPIEVQQPFIDLVDIILSKKEKNEDTSKEEAEIDKLVYELYDLTEEEIKIVEGE